MSRKSTKLTAPEKAAAKEIRQLLDSTKRGQLVAVIGTGVSLQLTDAKIAALSWKGLIADGFAYALKKGKITDAQFKSWKPQRESDDLDDLLSAAEFVGRRLEAPQGDIYSKWLADVFKTVKPTNSEMVNAVKVLHGAGVPLCTLNYDSLLEGVTGLPTLTLEDAAKTVGWMRGESPAILHLHGSWEVPATCILGIRDYETTLHDDVRDLIQRALSSFRRLANRLRWYV